MLKYFRLVDLVGRAPPLLIDNNKIYKTTVGAICTIIILIISITSVCFFGQELFKKEAPSVNFSTKGIDHPPLLEYDEDTFELAFGLQNSDKTLYINESIYVAKATLSKSVKKDSELKFETFPIQLVPCQNKIFNEQNNELFSKFRDGTITAYCFANGQVNLTEKIGLNDYWGNEGFKMIQIKLFRCDQLNYTKCSDKEVIDEQLKQTHFSFYWTDHLLHTQNHTYPFRRTLKNNFWRLTLGSKVEVTQYFRHLLIFDDDNLIFSSKNEKKSFEVESVLVSTSTLTDETSSIFTLTFQLNNEINEYYRSYYKFQDLAAQTGGIYSSILLASTIILFFYNSNIYYQYLINHLFDIKPSGKQVHGVKTRILIKLAEQPSSLELSNIQGNTSINIPNPSKRDINANNQSHDIEPNKYSTSKDDLPTKDDQPKERKITLRNSRHIEGLTTKTKIQLNFLDHLFLFNLCPRYSFSRRYNLDKLFDIGKRCIMEKTNIIYIISQGFSFEMFKNLLFTDEQNKIFEIIKRPMLTNWMQLNANKIFDSNEKLIVPICKIEELMNNFQNDDSPIAEKMKIVLKRNLL